MATVNVDFIPVTAARNYVRGFRSALSPRDKENLGFGGGTEEALSIAFRRGWRLRSKKSGLSAGKLGQEFSRWLRAEQKDQEGFGYYLKMLGPEEGDILGLMEIAFTDGYAAYAEAASALD